MTADSDTLTEQLLAATAVQRAERRRELQATLRKLHSHGRSTLLPATTVTSRPQRTPIATGAAAVSPAAAPHGRGKTQLLLDEAPALVIDAGDLPGSWYLSRLDTSPAGLLLTTANRELHTHIATALGTPEAVACAATLVNGGYSRPLTALVDHARAVATLPADAQHVATRLLTGGFTGTGAQLRDAATGITRPNP